MSGSTCMIFIIAERVMRTRKQSGVHQILRVCKERACVCAGDSCSQNFVRNNSNKFNVSVILINKCDVVEQK